MGCIAGVIEGSADRTERVIDPQETDSDTPYLSRDLTDSLDPFLTEFTMDHVRLSDRDLHLILGLMIVISNLLGD